MAKHLIPDIMEHLSRFPDNWLIGYDGGEVTSIAEQKLHNLTQLANINTRPIILLAEREPVQFIASFIASCAAGCQIFLCNPNWVKQEWEQVFELVNPDIIWGQEAEYLKENYQLPIINYPLPINNYPLIMIPTGGSSGKIKFAMHTWETLNASIEALKQYFQLSVINSFCVLPLYHVSGLMQFMRSFTTSGKLVIMPFKALESGETGDINSADFFISLVPTQLQRLLQNPYMASWLSRFHTVLLGGAPAWDSLLEEARKHRIQLSPTYGMTETASQIATLKAKDFLAGNNSYGQILPHAQVTISSLNHEILSYNQIGNITIKGDSLALGYYPQIFANRDNFQTDDIGYLDKNGYLNIVGRSSDKIITGGENVFPAEVEAAIRATALVVDVCVIGLPDKLWGQVVTAVYVPKNSGVSTASLQIAIEDKLSKFKQPKYWVSIESFPRNSQGKFNREQLQEIAIELLKPNPNI
ncbi:2-succinylbenzoate--CoA ligase [Kamptonema sp. UHCC 0994]|uniref:2-succinylbenzoate--CoA ligase n=1 Tax=Kamptonema sp. UHCC 0994 TaxID=3031329 RepID=UPI0023BA27BD|nr:2-succinylbenzoate--CoA ligase [Kamptonema sp. UHCC 0994]MDF0555404.1 2-succinylbenzoate--CoA ligase [Kamptonema sp. UHCC 0994]